MRNTKAITEATTRSPWSPKRVPKKSGMVRDSMCCVISLVRFPSSIHASSEPIRALPMPIHVADIPYFQPNCPA